MTVTVNLVKISSFFLFKKSETCYNRKLKGVILMSDFVIVSGEIQKYVGDKEEIEIPEGIRSISRDVFRDKKIKKVTFPKSLEYIGYAAFANNELEEVRFHSPVKLDDFVFGHNHIKRVKGLIVSMSNHSFKDNPIMNQKFVIIGGILIAYNGKSDRIKIPEGVRIIKDWVFAGKGIKEISFPKSLVEIKESAFFNNEIEEVCFKSPIILREYAFERNKIKKVDGIIKEIYTQAFCDNPVNLSEKRFKEGLEIYGDIYFNGTVTLPSTTKQIFSDVHGLIILLEPKIELLEKLDKHSFVKYLIKTKYYNPKIQKIANKKGFCYEYEEVKIDKNLFPKEFESLLQEIEDLINILGIKKINGYKKILEIAQEYEDLTQEYKPVYQKGFDYSYTPSIFKRQLEMQEKLKAIKETLQIRIVLEKIENLNFNEDNNNDEELLPILKYLQITEDKKLKRDLIAGLNTLLTKIKGKENGNLILINTQEENLTSIIRKYRAIASQKHDIIEPYYNLYLYLNEQIKIVPEKIESLNPNIKRTILEELKPLIALKNYLYKIIKTPDLVNETNFEEIINKVINSLNVLTSKIPILMEFNPLINTTENYLLYTDNEVINGLPTINDVLIEIYTLMDLANLDDATKKQIEEDIAAIMKKWQTQMIKNDFAYNDECFKKIKITAKMKYELAILKDLYKIIFDLNQYIEDVTFYKTLKK